MDYQLPQRFGLSYRAQDGSLQTPVVIHRVVYGSIERFLGILIEHTGGDVPFWIAPLQMKVLLLGDDSEYHRSVGDVLDEIYLRKPLRFNKLRFEVDTRNESLSRKIRECELQKVPVVLLIGDQEAQERVVTVRRRGVKDQIKVRLESLEDFLAEISQV